MKKRVSQGAVNAVAEAISQFQMCGSCAGTTSETRHCATCEGEAKVAIRAFQKYKEQKNGQDSR